MAIQLLLTKKHQKISFAGRTSASIDLSGIDEVKRYHLLINIEDQEIIVSNIQNKTKDNKLLLFSGYKLNKPKPSPHS